MYKLCKTEQSAQRQRQLEDGLLAAMAVCHYDEISVSDLCDRLGIPRKSFYRYFSGKDGALHALIDHTLMRYEIRELWLAPSNSATAYSELENYFAFWLKQKPLLDVLARSGLSGVLVERSIAYALQESGFRVKPNVPVMLGQQENAILFVISGLMTMTVHWHHSGYAASVSQMAQMAANVMTKPLFPGF